MIPNIRHNFVCDVFIILNLPNRAVSWVHPCCHPSFAIDAVDGINLELAGFDELSDDFDYIKALVLQIVSGGGGEQEQGKPLFSIGDDLHVLIEAGAVPAVYEALHR